MPHDFSNAFSIMMLKQVGTSGQIALGKSFAGAFFQMTEFDDGMIELRPMEVIPRSQAFAHTPAMREKISTAKAWSQSHATDSHNQDAMLNWMDERATQLDAAERVGKRRPKASPAPTAATSKAVATSTKPSPSRPVQSKKSVLK